jgi:GlpG protein
MRQIGSIDNEKQALLFSDYLLSQQIKTQIDQDEGAWTVWVRDEDQLEESRRLLAEFRENPDHDKFPQAIAEAAKLRLTEQREAAEQARNTVDVRNDLWSQPTARRSPLTMVLGIACVAVALFTSFGANEHGSIMRSLLFADPVHELVPQTGPNGQATMTRDTWRDIRGGQIWRVITPIFVHLDVAHIAFNMIWLFSLGGMIESRRSTAILAMVVFASAIGGNIGQAIVAGPGFGGMSGVVYGLLGFIWIRMYISPGDRLGIARDTIIFMMIWMILGFMGVLKAAFDADIANTAHLCGLLAGILVAIALPTTTGKEKVVAQRS